MSEVVHVFFYQLAELEHDARAALRVGRGPSWLGFLGCIDSLLKIGGGSEPHVGLDLTLVTMVAEPYALARCLSRNASADSGAIFIDIGGGTTDIAMVRQGGIEETRMFALGGRTFTRRLAAHKGLSIKDAEKLKVNYSLGTLKGNEKEEIQQIFTSEVQTWMDSVELLIEELAKGELLPPAVYMVGGGSGLPDLYEKLESFPWTERLPFSHHPIIQTIQPGMVTSIADPNHLLKNAQDITPMALAYQAIELQNEDSELNFWSRDGRLRRTSGVLAASVLGASGLT